MSDRAKLIRDGYLSFFCPGCKTHHTVTVSEKNVSGAGWHWNGSLEKPTLSPSVLVRWDFGEERKPRVCHSFVRDGKIQFLNDCTHSLAGQTVDLPEVGNV